MVNPHHTLSEILQNCFSYMRIGSSGIIARFNEYAFSLVEVKGRAESRQMLSQHPLFTQLISANALFS